MQFCSKKDILIFFLGLFLGAFLSYLSFLHNPVFFFKKQEINCQGLVKVKDKTFDEVLNVIDGDTLLMKGGYYVRLAGINADEKGERCYQEAKERLTQLVLGKKVFLKRAGEDKDHYCRYLREVFVEGENIALKLLQEGLVRSFLVDSLNNKQEFLNAEKIAKERKTGCQWTEREKKIIPVCLAKSFINNDIITQGRVVSVFRSKNNNIFLNLEKTYPHQCLTLVIFSAYLSNFPSNPEKLYLNKMVEVEGFLQMYENQPEIILKTAEQIKIID